LKWRFIGSNTISKEEKMGKKRMVLAALSLTLFLPLWGCYESDFPLGPPTAGKIDPKIVGKWRCVQSDAIQNKAIHFTVSPFDDKQYSINVSMEGEKPISYRAYSSFIKIRLSSTSRS
jgi:hypothetical protein